MRLNEPAKVSQLTGYRHRPFGQVDIHFLIQEGFGRGLAGLTREQHELNAGVGRVVWEFSLVYLERHHDGLRELQPVRL